MTVSGNDLLTRIIHIAFGDTGVPSTAYVYSARVGTTANITLSGAQTIDGLLVVQNDIVLVKNQSTASQNGIYQVAVGAWSRVDDGLNEPNLSAGAYAWTDVGTANANKLWKADGDVAGWTFTELTGAGGAGASTVYSPFDYGAVGDGLTDDLPAFQAMHDALSTNAGSTVVLQGSFYLSDTWRVSRQVWIQAFEASMTVAPGRSAIRLDGTTCSLDGQTSDLSLVEKLNISSRMLIHGTANGSALGRGIGNFWNSSNALRKNDCVIKVSGSTTIFFRCTVTGAGDGIGTLTTEPVWNTTIGGATNAEGLTFITEAFPTVRANLTHYTAGQSVFADKDNRVYFVCESAGDSAASPPTAMLGGDSATGLTINGTVTDGTVTWRTRMATGILAASTFPRLSDLHVQNFTGPSLAFLGGTGQLDDAALVTDVNFARCKDVFLEYCGMGVYIAGDNANGWQFEGASMINLGTLLPTPNAALAAGYTNLGGHCLHDASLGGGEMVGAYLQLSTGRGVLKSGLGRTSLKANTNELDAAGGKCVLKNGAVWIDGGNLGVHTSSNSAIVYIDPNGDLGRGLQETDDTGARTLKASILSRDGFSAHAFSQTGDTNSALAWRYNWASAGTGWWAISHGPQNGLNAIAVSEANATEGPGLWADMHGHFSGLSNRFWHGSDFSEATTTLVRGGSWIVGDRWDVKSDGQVGSYTRVIVKTAGYRGAPWAATHLYQQAFATWGIFGEQVEPTTHDPTFPVAGGRVFRCTVGGTSGGTEPNWALAPNTNDTIADATVVWTNVGTVAEYNRDTYIGPTGIPTSRTLTAGTGLTGGGDLSADRTFNVIANADGSIVANADDIQVGVLATDTQHGVRGGGAALHPSVSASTSGFAPASGGGTTTFLRADATWALPPSGPTGATGATGATGPQGDSAMVNLDEQAAGLYNEFDEGRFW